MRGDEAERLLREAVAVHADADAATSALVAAPAGRERTADGAAGANAEAAGGGAGTTCGGTAPLARQPQTLHMVHASEGHAVALWNLARLLRDKGKDDEAVRFLQSAVAAHEQVRDTLTVL